jgi:twitching motility protein PilU
LIKEAMEQSMAPGSQTFEQDLFRLYKTGAIAIEEALANADSPTNLSWLINNSEFGDSEIDQPGTATTNGPGTPASAGRPADAGEGASFKEFTISLTD